MYRILFVCLRGGAVCDGRKIQRLFTGMETSRERQTESKRDTVVREIDEGFKRLGETARRNTEKRKREAARS